MCKTPLKYVQYKMTVVNVNLLFKRIVNTCYMKCSYHALQCEIFTPSSLG